MLTFVNKGGVSDLASLEFPVVTKFVGKQQEQTPVFHCEINPLRVNSPPLMSSILVSFPLRSREP